MENFDIEEIRKLREEVEALRREVARLEGRLDSVEKVAEDALLLADELIMEKSDV